MHGVCEQPGGGEEVQEGRGSWKNPRISVCSEPYIEGNEIVGVPAGVGGDSCEGRRFSTDSNFAEAVTVDAAGDLFLDVGVCLRVFEYRPSGEYVREFDLEGGEVPGLGVRPGGGVRPGVVVTPEGGGLAVDGTSGHLLVGVYVSEPQGNVGGVYEFSLGSGLFVDRLVETGGGEALERPRGVVVDSRGDVYVADPERGVVDVWGAGAYYPTVGVGCGW